MLARTRWKLVAWSAASTLVLLLLLGSGLYLAIERQLRAESEDRLERRATLMSQGIPPSDASVPAGSAGRLVGSPTGCPEPAAASGLASSGEPASSPASGASTAPCQVLVSVPAGAGQDVVWSLPATVVDDPTLPGLLLGGPASGTIAMVRAAPTPADGAWVSGFSELEVMGTPMRVLSSSLVVGGRTVSLQVAQDRTLELDTLRATLLVLVGGGALAMVAAGALGYRYAGRALVPIQDALRHQREFAADASHELRTPLAVIRGSVQALRRRPADPDGSLMLDDIDAEADRMAVLVDQLLLLARADSGVQEVDIRSVDLGEATADALEPLARVADARHVALELDVAPALMQGDPVRLRQLVAILVDNAIRHAPERGHVRVAVATGARHATLTVDDDGPGVRPGDRQRVFERFWRAPDAPSGGSGLGLAIAAWIVDRHGGTIAVGDRPGGGARFSVRLPATPA